MPIMLTILRWTVRVTGLLALLLGLGLWNRTGFNLLGLHQELGLMLSASLIWISLVGFVRSVSPVLSGVALVCGLALPMIGSVQGRLLPGPNHWLIEALHLALGVGAIVLAELIGRLLRTRPEPALVRSV
ncbi:hypothetical protein [Deinococcus sp. UYEF24]